LDILFVFDEARELLEYTDAKKINLFRCVIWTNLAKKNWIMHAPAFARDTTYSWGTKTVLQVECAAPYSS
jgi:hypothetical protein